MKLFVALPSSRFRIPVSLVLALAATSLAPASRALTLQSVATYTGNNLIAPDSGVVGRNSLVGVGGFGLAPSVGTPGTLQPLVTGYPAVPGATGLYYEPKLILDLTPAGQVAFTADFTTSPNDRFPSFSGFGVFTGTPGSAYSLLFKNDDPAPGTNGLLYGPTPNDFNYQPPKPTVLQNVNGQITFDNDLHGPGVATGTHPRGLWTGTPGNVALVLKTGDPAPGITGFTFFQFTGVAAADDTLIICGSATDSNGANSRDGTWTKTPTGAITPLFINGTPSPTGSGATFKGTKFVAVSDNGNVAANVGLDDANGSHDSIVLARHSSNNALFVLALGNSTPVPGQAAGIIFTNRLGTAVVNDDGAVVFLGSWFGNAANGFKSGDGLFAKAGQSGSALAPVVIAGQAAPGQPAGTTFGSFSDSLNSGSGFGGNAPRLWLNNRGQLAFFNFLVDPGASSGSKPSLWIADLSTGNLTLVVRRGDIVTLGTASKTIDTVDFATQANFYPRGGARRPFNDDGQLLLGATFTDGSSALLLATVTPPATSSHPPFFNGEVPLSNGVYYLAFPGNGNVFGYYAYLSDPRFIYHFDLGYEYLFDAQNAQNGVFLYDFASQSFFYTAPSFPFPYLYDFSLNAILYYFPDPNNPGRYNTDGVRYFYNFATGQIITK